MKNSILHKTCLRTMDHKQKSKTLFESVMWGTSKQVQEILNNRDLVIDDLWSDYALLVCALKRHRTEIAKILISKGCRVQKIPRTVINDTPLHYAIKIGDVEIVKLLLNKQASINDLNQDGESPLCFAVHSALKKRNYEIVDLILSINNIDFINVSNNEGLSHFHIACIRNNYNAVNSFLKCGVNINNSIKCTAKHWPGYTPLHLAICYNGEETVKLLLNHGADKNIKNADGITPLHLAIQFQNKVIIDLILSCINSNDINHIDQHGLSYFHIACMKHHSNAIKNLLQSGVDINHCVKSSSSKAGYTALHFAVEGLSVSCIKQLPTIELLLEHNADVNARNFLGQTPLHLACLQDDSKMSRLFKDILVISEDKNINKNILSEKLYQIISQMEQVQIVKLLLKFKSKVNIKDNSNESPLMYLYTNNCCRITSNSKLIKPNSYAVKIVTHELNVIRKEIVKLLLNYDADVHSYDNAGLTLLHLIAQIKKDFDDDFKEEIVEIVLNKGADVNIKTQNEGFTPLHLAAINGHWKLIELLLKFNANVNSCDSIDKTTPLHLATSYQQVKAIDMLLKNKANVSAIKRDGSNLLHIIASMYLGNSEEAEFIEAYEKIVTKFLELGCDINAQNINGKTPLHLASEYHNSAAVWIFLQNFADINIEDSAGETPLHFMNSSNQPVDIILMFKDYVNMLKLTGLHVSEKVDKIYFQMWKNEPLDPNNDFLMQCREEIERMKSVKINSHSSLFDMIFKTSHEMEVYANNELFKKTLNSADFEKNFNIYKNLLLSQHQKGLARKVLLKNTKESFECMIGFMLPDSCLEKIFQYLNNENLFNIIKANTLAVFNEKINYQTIFYNHNKCESLDKAIAYCKKLSDMQMKIE